MWRFLCNLGPYLSFCYRPPSKCYLRCQLARRIPPMALNPYLAPSFVPIQDIPYLIRSSITFCSGYSIKHHYQGLTWGQTRERTNDLKPGICFLQTWEGGGCRQLQLELQPQLQPQLQLQLQTWEIGRWLPSTCVGKYYFNGRILDLVLMITDLIQEISYSYWSTLGQSQTSLGKIYIHTKLSDFERAR